MRPELFQKIIDDLARTPPRRISLYLMNEPLLDKRLPDFVRYTTERIPRATTLVTSNGTRLSKERAEALMDAGLKRLKVSLQSLESERNERIMGYRSDGVIENILGVQRLIKAKRARNFDFRVSMIITNENRAEIEEARRFWSAHGVRLVTSVLENRGGNVPEADDLSPHAMEPVDHCQRPSRDLCLLFNGDAILCCVDWFRTETIGNVGEQSVREVWRSSRLEEIRRALREDDGPKKPDICVNCAESARPHHHRRGLKGRLSRLVRA